MAHVGGEGLRVEDHLLDGVRVLVLGAQGQEFQREALFVQNVDGASARAWLDQEHGALRALWPEADERGALATSGWWLKMVSQRTGKTVPAAW